MASGIQKLRPRKVRVVKMAILPRTFRDLKTAGMTPSTIPIPCGVGETMAKRIPMEYPATSTGNVIG
jgi:hypothetical protein